MAWDIQVSVKNKRVCGTTVGIFPSTPEQLWTLLALPETKAIFRVEQRKRLSYSEGVECEQVVFLAPVRILVWKKWARTEVHQVVDLSNPAHGTVDFKLMHSDMMSKLSGSWSLQQLQAPEGPFLGTTKVTYSFEMWPKGVPVAMRFMPGLLDAVKSAVARESAQLFDKLAFVASKVRPGVDVVQAAREASLEVNAAGGSFKCLQATKSGSSDAAAAAAAAEMAARQQLKLQQQEQQQQLVVCHALNLEEFSEDEEAEVPGETSSSNSRAVLKTVGDEDIDAKPACSSPGVHVCPRLNAVEGCADKLSEESSFHPALSSSSSTESSGRSSSSSGSSGIGVALLADQASVCLTSLESLSDDDSSHPGSPAVCTTLLFAGDDADSSKPRPALQAHAAAATAAAGGAAATADAATSGEATPSEQGRL